MENAQSYSPITDREKATDSPRSRGGFFRRLCCGWDDHNYLLPELHREEPWLVIQMKKLKQLSEVIAGPKWKNMIRKIGKLCKCRKEKAAPFQYSPESYALNFAGGEFREEDGDLLHSFSTRFAAHGSIADQQKKSGL